MAVAYLIMDVVELQGDVRDLKRKMKNLFDLQSGIRTYAQDSHKEVVNNSNAILSLDRVKQDKKKSAVKKTKKK